jgi:hypothetical protein
VPGTESPGNVPPKVVLSSETRNSSPMVIAEKVTPAILNEPVAANSVKRRKLTVEEGVLIILLGVGVFLLLVLGTAIYLIVHLLQALIG